MSNPIPKQPRPLRTPQGARLYNESVTLAKRSTTTDEFGHASLGEPVPVLKLYAAVRQMSAGTATNTFQQADIVGLTIEFRTPTTACDYDCILWRGHVVEFPRPEDLDGRGRYTRISGWYQTDNPKY